MSLKSEQGFSLLELSMVVVIIGLLLGGTLVGQNLIQASRLRSIYVDAESYITAVNNFKTKYESLPGDMYNAEDVWGQAAAGATCISTSNGQLTCSGNGNSKIEADSVLGASGATTSEQFRAWQQLNNAKMISANVSGVPGSGGNHEAKTSGASQNVPASRFAQSAGFILVNASGMWVMSTIDSSSHILVFGAEQAGSGTVGYILSVSEAQSIDTKTDDGKPGSGSVQASTDATCIDSATAYDAVNMTSTSRNCKLLFVAGF